MITRLIVGDGNSIHINNLVKEIKKKEPNCRVDLLNTSPVLSEYSEFDYVYQSKLLKLWSMTFRRYAFIAWFINVLFWSFFRKNKINYHSIQLHFVSLDHRYTIWLYKLNCIKLVSVLWGSDLFRCKNLKVLKNIILKSDHVTSSTSEMKERILDICEGELQLSNIIDLKFGLSTLADLNNIMGKKLEINNLDQSELINKLIKLKDKYRIITIGHNASVGQQHLAIIQSLSLMSCFSNCLFVFPMTYGAKSEYIETVEKLLLKSGINYIIISEFMSTLDMAKLEILTEIFIQLQITDALSGAMQEHLFAGSHVITGTWLPYEELDNIGIQYTKVSSVNDIAEKLKLDLDNIEKFNILNKDNSYKIWNLSAYPVVIEQWLKI